LTYCYSHLRYTFQVSLRRQIRVSSTGSSFPALKSKPVPLAVVSLDSRQGQWESLPLVRSSSKLVVLCAGGPHPRRVLNHYRNTSITARDRSASVHPRGTVRGSPILGGYFNVPVPNAQPLEPILFPKLRIYFADFPCLHCSID